MPAYKAGGPVQSIANLVEQPDSKNQYLIFTSDTDLDGSILAGVEKDKWIIYNDYTQIFYCSKNNRNFKVLKRELEIIKPSSLFINGLYDWIFNIVPIALLNRQKKIISTRGMLQSGALAGKSLKKKLYLQALKLSGLVKNISWHATNEDEAQDIKKIFGQQATVVIAQNIPKQPVAQLVLPAKEKDKLRLVYLSLIAEKKNLQGLLELVLKCGPAVSLDIYGPPKDMAYWESCKKIIDANPAQLKYRGDVIPQKVQEIFIQYDASILLTRGENFGHALYESLSAGRPIITSFFTPWNELEVKKAGWNVDIDNLDSCLKKLEEICQMNAETFNAYYEGAYEVAGEFYKNIDLSGYDRLFGGGES